MARSKGKTVNRDAALLNSVFDNEPDAWQKMVQRYAPAVRAVACLVFDRYREPAAEEDLDEVTLAVFREVAEDGFHWLRGLRSPEMLDPSLRTLAAWRSLGLLRAKYRVFTAALESEAKIGKHHVATAVLADPPEKERAPCMSREDLDRLIAQFLEAIGSRPAGVLREIYDSKMSYAKIAEKNGMPVASVAQTVFEERKRLADRLAKASPGAGL